MASDKSRILYTKPSITDLEVRYATDAAANLQRTMGPPAATVPPARPAPAAPAAALRPLQGQPNINDRVVVPQEIYPAYACNELGGAGWTAKVTSSTGRTAVVEYLAAEKQNGQRFERVRLPLTALKVRG